MARLWQLRYLQALDVPLGWMAPVAYDQAALRRVGEGRPWTSVPTWRGSWMPSPVRLISLAAALALLAAPIVWAQGAGKPAPEEQSGLKVAVKAPKFTLTDQEGQERSLDEFLKAGKVALVFYRSADW
jgi:hypothetical protein